MPVLPLMSPKSRKRWNCRFHQCNSWRWNCRFRTLKCIHIAVFKRSLHCRAFYDSLIWFALWKVQFIIAYINLVAEESEISKYRQNGSALQENIFPLVLFWRCRVCTHKMTSGNGAKMQCLWEIGDTNLIFKISFPKVWKSAHLKMWRQILAMSDWEHVHFHSPKQAQPTHLA